MCDTLTVVSHEVRKSVRVDSGESHSPLTLFQPGTALASVQSSQFGFSPQSFTTEQKTIFYKKWETRIFRIHLTFQLREKKRCSLYRRNTETYPNRKLSVRVGLQLNPSFNRLETLIQTNIVKSPSQILCCFIPFL